MPKKNVILIVTIILFLLCIPLIAMQFSDGVQWDIIDFIIAASILLVTGFIIEFVIRKISNSNYRLLIILVILLLMILTFIEIGVGIFDSPISGD